MDNLEIRSLYEKIKKNREILSADEVIRNNIPVVVFSEHIFEAIQFFKEKLPHFFIIDNNKLIYSERNSYILENYQCKYSQFEDLKYRNIDIFAYIKPNLCGSSQYGYYHMYSILKTFGFNFFYHNELSEHPFFSHQALPKSVLDSKKFYNVFNLLADDDSKDIYIRIVKTLITKDIGYLDISPYPRFYHPIVSATTGDFVVEGGLFDGKTTEDFALRTGPTGCILGFEAFPKFATNCIRYLDCYPWVTVVNYGLWNSNSTLQIEEWENPYLTRLQNAVTDRSIKVSTITLDTFLKNNEKFHNKFDLLKLNIEGAELKCLEGAVNVLKRMRPKLMISLFHEHYSIFDIPIFISENLPEYEFYIGHHTPNVEQTYLYAIPKEKKLECNVLFVGCGNAYKICSKYFKYLNPKGIFVDEKYIHGTKTNIDNINLYSLEQLKDFDANIPIIIFSSYQNMNILLQRMKSMQIYDRKIFRVIA